MVPEGRRHATSDIWTIGEAALRAISVAETVHYLGVNKGSTEAQH
jgi:hypothetical protein